jgi:uncharacterized membrane protein
VRQRVGPPMLMWTLYGLVLVVRVVTTAWAAVTLPDRVASSFDASGAARGWTTRSGYLALDIGMSAVLMLGMPMLSRLANGSGAGVNIPNREYWFRPENRFLLKRLLTGDLVFIACVTGLLLTWLTVSVVVANRQPEPSLGASSMLVVGAYVLVILARVVWMYVRRYAVPLGDRAAHPS